jgi:hypothetical protein
MVCAVVLVMASMLCYTDFATATSISLYVDSLYVNSTSASSVVYSWFPDTNVLSAAQNGTFVNMAHGTYPGTTNMSIYDEILDVTSSPDTGTGNVLVWLFDIATDIRDATDFKVRELVTHTFTVDGTEYVYDAIDGANITGISIDSAVWQSVGVSDVSLADGHVNQGYYWWWDEVADIDTYSYETATSFYVEYSTDNSATWSAPASLTVNVIPEPATICLLAIGSLAFIGRKK